MCIRDSDVGVGDPEVEGDGRGLEREADQGERDTGHGEGVELPGDVLQAVRDLREVQRSGDGVDEADAHQRHGGGGDGGQEELQGGLGGEPVAAAHAHEREGGQGGDLQRDDQGGEVAGGRQQGGAGGGGEQQEPVLAGGHPRVAHGGDRQERGEQGAGQHQELDDHREVVGDVAAGLRVGGEAEGGAVAGAQRQQGGGRGGQAGHRDPAEDRLVALGDEEVGDEDGQADDGGDHHGCDGEPVDGLDQAGGLGREDRQGRHELPPARSC